MSPRAKPLTGDALRQAIREEIERFWNVEVRDDPRIAMTLFACQSCPMTFQSRPEALQHDLAVHLDGRIAAMEARLRERKGRA